MSLRARIFIIISILVFLTLGITVFLVVRQKNANSPTPKTGGSNSATTSQNNTQSANQTTVGDQVPDGLTVKKPTSVEAEKNGVEQLAKVFIERYGTYSTDNNFQNIKEVSTLVTDSLWSKLKLLIEPKAASSTDGFVGVTTKAISATLSSWSDSKATVDIKVMRTEEKKGVVSTRYQNVSLDLVKTNSLWLVDKVTWN